MLFMYQFIYNGLFFIDFRANEYVRKVFSCDFMGRQSAAQRYRQKLIDKVKSNNFDSTSCEVQSMIT